MFQTCTHTSNIDHMKKGLGALLAEVPRAFTTLGLLDISTSQYELDGHKALRLERDQNLGLCLCLTLLSNQKKLGLQTKGED